jgi:actin-related protein
LFQPSFVGSELPGIDNLVSKSIRLCDIDVRRDLYSNVVLSGGTTMFKGLPERLAKEMQS